MPTEAPNVLVLQQYELFRAGVHTVPTRVRYDKNTSIYRYCCRRKHHTSRAPVTSPSTENYVRVTTAIQSSMIALQQQLLIELLYGVVRALILLYNTAVATELYSYQARTALLYQIELYDINIIYHSTSMVPC